MPDILLVEDKDSLRRVLRLTLEHAGYTVTECADAREAAAEITRAPYRLVLTDLRMPHGSGLDVLRAARTADPDVPVVVMTAYGSVDEAVQAMKDGAHDFLQKPVDSNHLLLLVARALEQARIRTENVLLREEWSRRYGFPRIIGESAAIKRAVSETQRVAPTDATVLLLGESGTGKELFARAVHHLSPRRDQPFVAINCAAIPENLLEAELFGYERGAFTGAVKTTPGKIEQAQGGTLFLDEVGDIPLALQVKLLRFLQERVIERIGGRVPIAVDTRIVCATHQDLDAMTDDGRFRDDLYYRLAEIVIAIPGLAERAGDAVLLARHFTNRFARELKVKVQGLAPDAIDAIDNYPWPGNVRELENRIKRAVIMADGKQVGAADLDLRRREAEPMPINLRAAREVIDRRVIRQALTRTEHNISGAAKLLGISRPTLYDLMKQYQLGS